MHGQDVFAAVFFSVQLEKSAKMVEPTYFLLRWSVDGSLSVSTANAIQSGEKVVGGEVTALYQRKLYDATIVAHGKFLGFIIVDLTTKYVEPLKIICSAT